MFGIKKSKISNESYKGVRDFYPEDQAIQNYIFGVMKKVVEGWGYLEYSASILEPLELYKSKTSEEIINEQIYSFTDRGGRDVALRPEMTPTVARMVSARIMDLPLPIRWYSIPNVFRYEKPQRGRLREHWQLNVDMFGIKDPIADAEIISIVYDIMTAFGAKEEYFVIKINSRDLLNEILEKVGIKEDKNFIYRLLDKREKMSQSDFVKALETLVGEDKSKVLIENLYYGEGILPMLSNSENARYLNDVINILRNRRVKNIIFSPTLTRGFDYYTGVVFEVFDTDEKNHRSIFGGGRYDNLLGIFAGKEIPALGFGMGDVTIRDFLITHNIMPQVKNTIDLCICIAPDTKTEDVYEIARKIRENDIRVFIDISGKKLADQLKSLDKRNIPFVLTIGSDEIKNEKFVLRNTKTREEKAGDIDEIIKFLKNNL